MKPNESKGKKAAPRKRKHTARDKVRQHLKDKHHVITDEDLRDVVIGPEAVDMDAEKDKHPEEKVEKAAEKMQHEIPEKKKGTPWDVIGEG